MLFFKIKIFWHGCCMLERGLENRLEEGAGTGSGFTEDTDVRETHAVEAGVPCREGGRAVAGGNAETLRSWKIYGTG